MSTKGSPSYIFDDRFIEVMPHNGTTVADVFEDLAIGLRQQQRAADIRAVTDFFVAPLWAPLKCLSCQLKGGPKERG